jgi:hypothetical protein
MNRRATERSFELRHQFFERHRLFRRHSDFAAFVFQKAAGGRQSERLRDLGVVAEHGMDIQRQMSAVNGKTAVSAELELLKHGPRPRLQAAPEHAVMYEKQIRPAAVAFCITGSVASTAATILVTLPW